MEQHPVPQNITSFEFRLIGDMTLKQFGLLAGGAILGYICWQLPLPSFIRIPLAFIFGFLGVAFAFLPLEERPLHRWFLAFLKAAYSPTQYLFQKSEKAPLYLTPDFPKVAQNMAPTFYVLESRRKLEAYLKTLPQNLPTTLDSKEADSLKKIQALLGTIAAFPSQRPVSPGTHLKPTGPTPLKIQMRGKTAPLEPLEGQFQPFSGRRLTFSEGGRLIFEEEKKSTPTIPFSPAKIASRNDLLVEEIKKLKLAIAELRAKQPSGQTPQKELFNYEERMTSLQQQLEEAEQEKESLMRAMLRLQKEMVEKPKGVVPTEVLEKSQAVKIISAEAAKEIGLAKLTNIPNVVTGVVQSKKGGFLPNILVEIKDTKSNSVRAFKTNRLGQFAAATPLENGTYTLELEDPRHEFVFDIIEMKVDGSVLPPLAFYARGQADLEKEKIHQSLFGGN